MRKPPIPRAVPHRLQRERWAAAGACGVLAIGHTARVAVDAHHLAYLSVLDVAAIVASIGAGVQLALDRRRHLLGHRRGRRGPGRGRVSRLADRRLPRHRSRRGRRRVGDRAGRERCCSSLPACAGPRLATRRVQPPPRTRLSLRDGNALEHRRPHAALSQLGEERNGLDEHAETLHARLLDDGPDRTRQARR